MKATLKKVLGETRYARVASRYLELRQLTHQPNAALKYPRSLRYAGDKLICLDMIPVGSTVLSAGLGDDIDFEVSLIRSKKTRVIGLDPTEKSAHFVAAKQGLYPEIQRLFEFRQEALSSSDGTLRLYCGDDYAMASVSVEHREATTGNYFDCRAISLPTLLHGQTDVSYLKIDIEGAEYAVLNSLTEISVPQISVEFHHHCMSDVSLHETIDVIQKMCALGYDAIDYGSYFARDRFLPEHASLWSDVNCEVLFIKPPT